MRNISSPALGRSRVNLIGAESSRNEVMDRLKKHGASRILPQGIIHVNNVLESF